MAPHHQEFLEERLVELALEVLRCRVVRGLALFEEVECDGEARVDVVVAGGCRVALAVELLEGLGDPFLFTRQQFEGNCARVVGFHEFGPLAFELVAFGLDVALLGLGGYACRRELGADGLLDELSHLVLDADGAVVLGDLLLNLVDEDGLLGAGGSP